MFSNDDINGMGETSLSEKESLSLVSGDMEGQWESLENLRLKKDGKYAYWMLRDGLSQIADLTSNIIGTYGFEARVGAQVKSFLAIQVDSGVGPTTSEVRVYNTNTDTVEFTLTGFTNAREVQMHSSGQFLYVFNEGNSKYVNLSNGVISDYLTLGSSPITNYSAQGTTGIENVFSLKPGDTALVLPPDISDFSTYRHTYSIYRDAAGGGDIVLETEDKTWSTINGTIYGFDQKHYAVTTLVPGKVYSYLPGSESGMQVDDIINKLEYTYTKPSSSGGDPGGEFYFSVSEKTHLIFTSSDQNFSVPEINYISLSDLSASSNFGIIRYATIYEDGGDLYANIENGGSVKLSDPNWAVLGIDESTIDLAGRKGYESIDNSMSIKDLANNGNVDVNGSVNYKTHNYLGSVSFSDDSGQGGTFYRKYVIVDMLDDGSTCMPGKPVLVTRNSPSSTIGFKLTVDPPNNNVAKRFLCGSRYLMDKDECQTPSSQEYPNGPLFVIREVGTNTNEIYDFSSNNTTVRPLSELLPLSNGVPAIMQSGSIKPKSIASFSSTIAIGGYEVNRPTPSLYGSGSSTIGNIFTTQIGMSTTNKAVIYFEYQDGTYSNKVEKPLLDGSNSFTLHSLNSLVSTVHIYVNDGTNDYRVGAYQSEDPEFGGRKIGIGTDFSQLVQEAIPTGLEVRESIDLGNYVTIPLPVQNIQIASQAKIFGNDSIVGLEPLDYDPDRNPLRYRLQVFTTDNIQTGYITEVQQGSIISYNSDFEVSISSRRAKDRKSIKRIDGTIFFQDDRGINAMSGSGVDLMISNDEYPVAKSDLTEIVYNEPDGEIWFLFNDPTVLVFDTDSGSIRKFEFGSGNISSASYHNNNLFISSDSILCQGESGNTDLGISIVGEAITSYLGSNLSYTELHEIHVYGDGSSVTVQVDDQEQREPYASVVDGFNFIAEKSIGPKDVKPNGTIFVAKKRGIKMRLGFEITNNSTRIEDIVAKFTNQANPM